MKTEVIREYHAHIYYAANTRRASQALREKLFRDFPVNIGRWHAKPVGPHPQPMYQVKFKSESFAQIVPWLIINHCGLSILVHPCTGRDLLDHTEFAIWIGRQLNLRVGIFKS